MQPIKIKLDGNELVVSRSVKLQMGDKDAQRWAKIYQATGCTGYATKEQAVQSITELFL